MGRCVYNHTGPVGNGDSAPGNRTHLDSQSYAAQQTTNCPNTRLSKCTASGSFSTCCANDRSGTESDCDTLANLVNADEIDHNASNITTSAVVRATLSVHTVELAWRAEPVAEHDGSGNPGCQVG